MVGNVICKLSFSKKLLPFLAGLMALPVSMIASGQPSAALQAPAPQTAAAPANVAHERGDVAGNWQGTLQTTKALRIILVLAKTEKGWTAKMYSIDQGAQPINASSVSLNGSTLKYSLDLIGANYEGTVSADGNSIVGTWTQAGEPLTPPLFRARTETAWNIPAPPPAPKPMAENA